MRQMKPREHGSEHRPRGWRRMVAGIVLVVLAMAVLIWFVPARWATPLLESRLHGMQLRQVQGLLWEGRADRVLAADGRFLGALHWRLSRRALLGDVRLQVLFDGPALRFAGTMHPLSSDATEWRGVQLTAQLAAIRPPLTTPFGWPQGSLSLQTRYALLQGNWPMQLDATAQWDDAAMRTRAGTVALGTLQFAAHAERGTISTHMHDAGNGPLALDGESQVSPLGWRLAATLQPRTGAPALRRWLATLGRADASGTVYLQRRGGLAAALPAKGIEP